MVTKRNLYDVSNWQRVIVGGKGGESYPTFRISVEGRTEEEVEQLKKGLELAGLRSSVRPASFDTGTIRKGEKTLRISHTCFKAIADRAMKYTHIGKNDARCEYLAFSEILKEIEDNAKKDNAKAKAVRRIVNDTRGR